MQQGVSFVTGKPGGGKSYYAVSRVIEELAYGVQNVVTNLALELTGLKAEIERRTGSHLKAVAALDRLTLLGSGREFYLRRGNGWWLPTVSTADRRAKVEPDFRTSYRMVEPTSADCLYAKAEWTAMVSEGRARSCPTADLPGCVYVIDEIHVVYGSRFWDTTGPQLLDYLSQHRHLGDGVIVITQHVNQVDKAIHYQAEEYVNCSNLGRQRRFGFTLPQRVVAPVTLEQPGRLSKVVEVRWYKIDADTVGRCYRTMAAGGNNGTAKEQRRKGGIHWSVVVGGVACVFVGLMFVPSLFGRLAGSWLNGARKGIEASAPGVAPASVVTSQAVERLQPVEVERVDVPPVPGPVMSTNVYITGALPSGAGVRWYLSDGQSFRTLGGSVAADSVERDGVRYRWARSVQTSSGAFVAQ